MKLKMMRQVLMVSLILTFTGGAAGEGSGEAILKGLEKAAAREEALKKEAGTTGEGSADIRQSGRQERSFVCTHGDTERYIRTEYPGQQSGYACRVRYDSDNGFEYPWNARNQAGYCEPKALGLVEKLRRNGWDCREE